MFVIYGAAMGVQWPERPFGGRAIGSRSCVAAACLGANGSLRGFDARQFAGERLGRLAFSHFAHLRLCCRFPYLPNDGLLQKPESLKAAPPACFAHRSAPSPPDSEVNLTPAGSTIESCPVSPKFMEFPLRVSSASCAKNCEVGSMGSMVCVIDKIIYPARYF
jgi:hypothetical protein